MQNTAKQHYPGSVAFYSIQPNWLIQQCAGANMRHLSLNSRKAVVNDILYLKTQYENFAITVMLVSIGSTNLKTCSSNY